MDSQADGSASAALTRREFIGLTAGAATVVAATGWIQVADPAVALPGPDSGKPTKTFETFLRRREDQLRLKIEFWNLTLDTTGSVAQLKKLKSSKASYLVFQLGPQQLADRAFFKPADPDGPAEQEIPPGLPQPPADGTGEPPRPTPPPIDAALAGGSRLAFLVPAAQLPLEYSTEALLGWTRFNARVVPNAVPRSVTEHATGMKLRAPQPTETAIEYPWHLIVSPHAQSTWAHSPTAVDHGGPRTELWHTRLAVKALDGNGNPTADETNETDRTFRAVWCRDQGFADHVDSADPPPFLWDDSPFLMSLRARDRLDIVRLSADYRLAKDTIPPVGRPIPQRTTRKREFVPAAIDVEHLILSSLGGWLDSSFDNELDFKSGKYNSSLLQWRHLGAMGRDAYVRVVRKGFLGSVGFKGAIVKITERRFDHVDDEVNLLDPSTHPTGAYLRQQLRIVPTRGARVFAGDADMQNGGRRFAFRKVECLTRITPPLDEPDFFAPPDANAVFVPHVGGSPFLFQVRVTDWAGQEQTLGMPFVWIDDTLAYDQGTVQPIMDAFNSDGPIGTTKPVDLANRRITVAPAAKPGQTTFPCASMSFGMELPKGGYTADGMAAQGKPGFYPTTHRMSLNLPELAAAAGNTVDPPTVAYYEFYVSGSNTPNTDGVSGGFPPENPENAGEVFLARPPEAGASKLGVGARSGGGVITPSLDIQGFSRQLGPTGNTEDTKGGGFTPASFLDQNAKMLGGVLLTEVINVVGDILTGDGKDKALKITSTSEESPNRVETKIDWAPELIAAPPGLNLIVPVAEGNDASCDIKAQIVTNLDDPTSSTSRVDGRITNVTLCLFGASNEQGDPGATTFIKVPVRELTFRAGSNVKEDVDCDVGDISFHGPLDFVAKLAEAMSFGNGSGIKIDVDGDGLVVLLTVALPDITLGVMSLTNMKIDVGLTIPFDGSPVNLRFAFCSREAPFTLTVWVFGGGGFVGLVIGVDGVELLEFSFEFGGGWAIDIGVASGKVEAKAGIYFKLETVEENGKEVQRVHLEAYFRLHGSVDVMGLITVSITLYLALIYESPPALLVGEASLIVEVEVLVFSGSVEIKVRKVLESEEESNGMAAAMGKSVPRRDMAAQAALPGPSISLVDLLTAQQYTQYCDSYAPLSS